MQVSHRLNGAALETAASEQAAELVEAFRLSLHHVILRCQRFQEEISLAGEFGIRTFRGWFAMECLQEALGWPPASIVFGDEFDLLVLGSQRSPFVLLETKRPGKPSTPREYTRFEERLRWFPRLRAAFYTNGKAWHRVDLGKHSGGPVKVERRLALRDIFESPVGELADFLGPLLPADLPVPTRSNAVRPLRRVRKLSTAP